MLLHHSFTGITGGPSSKKKINKGKECDLQLIEKKIALEEGTWVICTVLHQFRS